jgi:hypothetical protein
MRERRPLHDLLPGIAFPTAGFDDLSYTTCPDRFVSVTETLGSYPARRTVPSHRA